MTARDVDLLQHKIDAITRAATRIRQHINDLHVLAYEPTSTPSDDVKVRASKVEHGQRTGDPQARRVWERASAQLGRIEDAMVGLERQVVGHFMVNTTMAEPSRGSLIRREEHAQALAKQRARAAAGEYVPVRLVDQPPHPGKARR